MTSEGLGEMFEGDSADMCAKKFPLVSMGGRAEGLACADPGATQRWKKLKPFLGSFCFGQILSARSRMASQAQTLLTITF